MLDLGDMVYFAHRTLEYGGLGVKERWKSWRLGVHFGMWLWVAVSAYAFGLALWRVCGLPDVFPDVLRRAFGIIWLILLACAVFIPRSRPDEMSEAAYNMAAKYANRFLLAAMWVLFVLLSPYMDGWSDGFATSRWNLMLYVSGVLLASYLLRALAFIYYDRNGFGHD